MFSFPYLFLFSVLLMAGCANQPLFVNPPSQAQVTQQATIPSEAVFIINGGDATISVVNASGTQVINTLKLPVGSFPHHAYLSPTSKTLAVSLPGMDFSGGHHGGHSMPGRFALMDTRSGEIKTIAPTASMHHNAIFSPDGREIWTAAMETKGRVLVYDAVNLKVLKEIPVGNQPAEVTFSADGTKVFVANGGSQSITAIERTTYQVLETIRVGENPVGAWTGSDNRMYVDNEDSQTISVINTMTLKVDETIGLGFMPGMAALHPNQQELWVSDATKGRVVVFSRSQSTNKFLRKHEFETGAGAHAIAFSKDAQTAYVTNQEAGTLSVINTITKVKWRDLKVGLKPNGIAIQ